MGKTVLLFPLGYRDDLTGRFGGGDGLVVAVEDEAFLVLAWDVAKRTSGGRDHPTTWYWSRYFACTYYVVLAHCVLPVLKLRLKHAQINTL
jgi:hypothetical protein